MTLKIEMKPDGIMKFQILITQDEDGIYAGRVSELRGCVSQGDTVEELMKNMKEAVELYLEVHPQYRTEHDEVTPVGVETREVA